MGTNSDDDCFSRDSNGVPTGPRHLAKDVLAEVVEQRERLRDAHARLWRTLKQIADNESDGERARWLARDCLETEKKRWPTP